MNEQLKKRLIGAVVLVALAVIFIPMLLDRGSESQIPTFGSNVPPKPETGFQTINIPLQVPTKSNEALPVTSREDAASYEAQEKADRAAGGAPADSPRTTAAAAPRPTIPSQDAYDAPSIPANRAEAARPQAAAPAPVHAPKPHAPAVTISPKAGSAKAPAAARPHPSGWAVQLGSYSKSANALTMRDRLRRKGFAAFVEQQKSAGALIYRVRVGPELVREKADALQVKLAKAGFKGVVMPHP